MSIKYPRSLKILLVCLVFSAIGVSGCAPDPKEGLAADMNKARDRVNAVYKKTLGMDLRFTPNVQELKELGIDTRKSSVNKEKMKKALEAEFGVEFPDRLFEPHTMLFDQYEYVGMKCYGLDKVRKRFLEPGPAAPFVREKADNVDASSAGSSAGSNQRQGTGKEETNSTPKP